MWFAGWGITLCYSVFDSSSSFSYCKYFRDFLSWWHAWCFPKGSSKFSVGSLRLPISYSLTTCFQGITAFKNHQVWAEATFIHGREKTNTSVTQTSPVSSMLECSVQEWDVMGSSIPKKYFILCWVCQKNSQLMLEVSITYPLEISSRQSNIISYSPILL